MSAPNPNQDEALDPDLEAFGSDQASFEVALSLIETQRAVEALLFAASGPLSAHDLKQRLPQGSDIGQALADLKIIYEQRGVKLVCINDRWQFRTAEDLAHLMVHEREEPRKLSKAAMETLAIIAYHQPVTRGEIEAVRGVGLSRGTLDVLLELNLIRLRGRRRSPGRPVTYGTTDMFLEQFSLPSLADLPGATEMRAAGLLDLNVPADFFVPDPAGTKSIEDPLGLDDLETIEFHQDFYDSQESSEAFGLDEEQLVAETLITPRRATEAFRTRSAPKPANHKDLDQAEPDDL